MPRGPLERGASVPGLTAPSPGRPSLREDEELPGAGERRAGPRNGHEGKATAVNVRGRGGEEKARSGAPP